MVSPNKNKKFPPEFYTDDEFRLIINQCSMKCPTGIRNRAILTVLYRAGLRCNALIQIKPKDINPENGTIRILNDKGDKAHTVGMDPGAWPAVLHWAEKRRSIGLNGHHSLFCTLRGESLKSSYLRTLCSRLGRLAGIGKRVHPHGFRHSMAYGMLREGFRIDEIQAQLGHSNAATTFEYLRSVLPGPCRANVVLPGPERVNVVPPGKRSTLMTGAPIEYPSVGILFTPGL